VRNFLLAGAVAGLLATSIASAQDTAGNIRGEAKAGDTIIVDNPIIGFHREMTQEKDGRYTLNHVPVGEYVIIVRHADGTAEPTKGVRVQTGATARVK
jgi:hypothetical protein